MLRLKEYQGEDDYWRVRDFLRTLYFADPHPENYWSVARLDYWRWHVNENIFQKPLVDCIFIWETDTGQIGAVLNAESSGEGFFQVLPQYKDAGQFHAMIDTAERRLAAPDASGEGRRLQLWAGQDDEALQKALTARGYRKGAWPEYQRWRLLDGPIQEPQPAEGYSLRALGDESELPARSWASWRAFHPNDPDSDYEGWDWYLNVQRCPLYRRDLDVVAVAPGGEIAGFITLWYDDVTRTGMFEPVGVVPEHQQRGLGKALMYEGLRRLKRLGAIRAVVGGYSEAANALYGAVMSPEYRLYERWQRGD